MSAKVRILDTGTCTMLELDGKTMGEGIDRITYEKEAGKSAVLTIRINSVDSFEFLPDGEFDRAVERVGQITPPETALPTAGDSRIRLAGSDTPGPVVTAEC